MSLRSLTTHTHHKLKTWQRNTFQGALAGAGWMLLACLLFSLLNVLVKISKPHLSLAEIVLYRNIPSVFILAIIAYFQGNSLKTSILATQWRRATLGAISMGCAFYATLHLPIALSMTLSYTHPIFLALIVIGCYREKLGRGLLTCLTIGMAGVLILLRPQGLGSHEWLGSYLGLSSGLFAALAYLNVQILAKKGEPEWRTVFYFSLFSSLYAVIGIMIQPILIHSFSWLRAGLCLGLGLFGLLGQLCLTRAFSLGHANVTSIFSYSTLIFASLWGWLFFNEYIDTLSIIGGLIILSSGIGVTWLKQKNSTPMASDHEKPI